MALKQSLLPLLLWSSQPMILSSFELNYNVFILNCLGNIIKSALDVIVAWDLPSFGKFDSCVGTWLYTGFGTASLLLGVISEGRVFLCLG